MARWAGIDQGNIRIISTEQGFTCAEYQVVSIPETLDNISNKELMLSYRYRNNEFYSKKDRKPANQQKVALVANYKMKCGLGTYSKFLFEKLVPMLGDYMVFAEEGTNLETENITVPDDKIITCWKRGESLLELVSAIKEYNPDVIIVNHEFGLFSNSRFYISFITQLSQYRMITIKHSVFPEHDDKSICEGAEKEIIVHQEGAMQALRQKGITAPIHIIPHGCYPFSEKRNWNLYKSKHTILQFGFGFKYKNFEGAIEVCRVLKEKYNDVYLTILFSESDFNKLGHQLYYDELIELINKYSLQDNVGIIRGYQSEKIVDSYLRTNRVALFNYKTEPGHFVWGSSGACRVALSCNLPVVSSNIPHFSDIPTIKGASNEAIAKEIDTLFSNDNIYREQLKIQKDFVLSNDWQITAQRYIDILENK